MPLRNVEIEKSANPDSKIVLRPLISPKWPTTRLNSVLEIKYDRMIHFVCEKSLPKSMDIDGKAIFAILVPIDESSAEAASVPSCMF